MRQYFSRKERLFRLIQLEHGIALLNFVAAVHEDNRAQPMEKREQHVPHRTFERIRKH
ncbi:MAG: hypothetical protein ABFS02_04740 [Pseudomonadota bacterium]